MANEEHLGVLRQGVAIWNKWREEEVGLKPDLSEANLYSINLSRADLKGVNLSHADLCKADLSRACLQHAGLISVNLHNANLSYADLSRANLREADLSEANLFQANLEGANLYRTRLYATMLHGANLTRATLSHAVLYGANLICARLQSATLVGAQLIRTDLSSADLTGCFVYGSSSWDIELDQFTRQENLVITRPNTPVITVDNIKVAQFIYLLLSNPEVRAVIDTITSKAVLILGRFSDDRKPILNLIREQLRKGDYVPIMFDFEKASIS